MAQHSQHEYNATCNVFRTAYFITLNNRPYIDHPKLLDLQRFDGINVDRALHSNVVCADIVDHIASEMKNTVLKVITNAANGPKKIPISILVDESTARKMIYYLG